MDLKLKKLTRRQRCVRTTIQAVGLIVLLNAAVTFGLVQLMAPRIVSFDMKGTVDQFMAQAAERGLTEVQSAALSARFTTALKASLEEYQQTHNAVILVRQATVSGTADITTDIKSDVAIKMRGE